MAQSDSFLTVLWEQLLLRSRGLSYKPASRSRHT